MSRCVLLTALLMLGGLVGGWAAPLQAAGTLPLKATRTVAGVRISLAAPPGPHFLGELVPVTVTLTNATGVPLHSVGGPAPSLCSGGWLSEVGGSAPFSVVPVLRQGRCLMAPETPLEPGHTAVERGLVPLTASGEVHLVARPVVVEVRGASMQYHRVLVGPSLLLHVVPTAPAARTLLLTYHNSTVRISVAQGVLPVLLVETMEDYTTGWGTTGAWAPLRGTTLSEPYSPSMGHPTTWTVLVGAPGYRVAVGVYTHAP